jgi:hypothetical protein
LIDLIVMIQHLARDFAVALAKGVHGARERLLRFASQQQNAIAQGTQFVVKMTVQIHCF